MPRSWRVRFFLLTLAFHVYHSGQGSQGLLGQVSKQDMDNVFGTTNVEDAIVQVLEKGHLQPGSTYPSPLTKAIKGHGFNKPNSVNSSAVGGR